MKASKTCTQAEFNAAKTVLRIRSAERVNALRQILVQGVAQAEVARACGISRQAINVSVTRFWGEVLALRAEKTAKGSHQKLKTRLKKPGKRCTDAEFDAAVAGLTISSPERVHVLRQIMVHGVSRIDGAHELGISRKTLDEHFARVWHHVLMVREAMDTGTPLQPTLRNKKPRMICTKDEFDTAITVLKTVSPDEIVVLRQILVRRADVAKIADKFGVDRNYLYGHARRVWNKILKIRSYGQLI